MGGMIPWREQVVFESHEVLRMSVPVISGPRIEIAYAGVDEDERYTGISQTPSEHGTLSRDVFPIQVTDTLGFAA